MSKLKILYTGGTIGGKHGSGGAITLDIKGEEYINLLYKKLYKQYPSLKHDLERKNVELSHDIPFIEFSENINPYDWIEIAESVNKAINEGIDGIVIVHGTDTMCYTSAALSFMLQGIKIPVVLTGSNTPLEMEGTDAVTNMHDAIRVALDNKFKGVFLVFSGINNQPSDIHLGCRVRKVKFRDNCFESVNVDMIGKFEKKSLSEELTIEIVNHQLLNQVIEINDKNDYQLESKIKDSISFFKVYPGFNPELIDYVIEKKETEGIILELYNSGTGCIKDRYLFSWDNVPGNDSERLLKFLWDDLDIGWAKNAEIRKSDDDICIFKDENSAEIMIDEEKKKATIKISDYSTHDLQVKKENGKLNIYYERKYSLLNSLEKAKAKEIPVFVTSQQMGSVTMKLYISSIKMTKLEAVPLGSMITEAAIPKLMWVLGQPSLKKGVFLFSWDDVPGNDSERLLRFLRDDWGIDCSENAEIHKSDDGKTIRIFKDENLAEITIDVGNEKVTFKISDGRTHDLKVKKENGKLNIYKGVKDFMSDNICGEMEDR